MKRARAARGVAGSGGGRAATPSPPGVDDLRRLIRKQEHDFTTVLEVATQINARILDDRHIESYLQFLSNYLTTLARGQFGVSKAFLFRQPDLEVAKIVLPASREGGGGTLAFDIEGAFGRFLQKHSAPFRVDETTVAADAPLEAAVLRRLGVDVCVPLLTTGPYTGADLKGLLCLGPKLLREPFTVSELKFIGLLANMAAVALHNAQLHRKSIVDDLTRLYSRGHFDLHLAAEISRAERYGRLESGAPRHVALILMDIDHFKMFNDAHGHLAGDRVLRAVARSLQRAVRKSDVVARYGGEEFALIAVETSKAEATTLAERLRRQVEGTTVVLDGVSRRVSASFGVATYPTDARTALELIARADGALYRAKEAGRNRVSVFSS